MKSTGIHRKVDDLGRIVIPAGLRKSLGIREGDALEVLVEGDRVVLAKPSSSCVFCGGEDDLQGFRDKAVCRGCVASVGALDERLRSPKPPDRPVRPVEEDDDTAARAAQREFEERYRADRERDPYDPASTTAW
ncbi:MAG: AbrB/MazE/SpoVT family DNA-binding domain-containing protein [Nitriliruptorales bacterium]|nr:AbrB/MazE/SpoVT family DNA-binding domain-containing protein [Nitriliruptorales bacterium]